MLENIVGQSAAKFIGADLKRNIFPRAVLFSGSEGDGKLSTALEVARILSCHSEEKKFNCTCPSCLQHKSLVSSNVMLLGPRDCFLEIAAAKKTFLEAQNQTYKDAARYLFIRSIRKLTMRFNSILYQGDSDVNKIGSLIESINEELEVLDFPKILPEYDDLVKICDKLSENTQLLESTFLYDSIPINQIRNMEAWAHIKSEEGKKVIIIENAEQMQNSVRNALLKILEEPPEDCQFILLTNKRNSIMETILSRVRTYDFKTRNDEQQKKVLNLVFHTDYSGTINQYLMEFLPVKPAVIHEQSKLFFSSIQNRKIPDAIQIIKKCEDFIPRVILKIFLQDLNDYLIPLRKTPLGCECLYKCIRIMQNFRDNINLYNQNPRGAMETLLRDLSAVNVSNGQVFKLCGDM
jgi:DNA polymerase III subunit gamma/tau